MMRGDYIIKTEGREWWMWREREKKGGKDWKKAAYGAFEGSGSEG